MGQMFDEHEQPQLLPGSGPIIQIAEGPILQQPQKIRQPKAKSKTSESSMIPKSLYAPDMVIPVHDYVTPQSRSRDDSISRTISYFQEPPELKCLVSTGNLVQKCLPKQADIDEILKIIQRKVLKVCIYL